MGTIEQNTKMGEIPVKVDEMLLLADLLKENAKRLAPAFVQSVSTHPNILYVSFLTSISEEMQTTVYPSLSIQYNYGTSGVLLKSVLFAMLHRIAPENVKRNIGSITNGTAARVDSLACFMPGVVDCSYFIL